MVPAIVRTEPVPCDFILVAAGNQDAFAVHSAIPSAFGDEGAANHMRFAPSHGERCRTYGADSRRPSMACRSTLLPST